MKLSVESDALVIPKRSGLAVAGVPPEAITRWFSSRKTALTGASVAVDEGPDELDVPLDNQIESLKSLTTEIESV